MKWVEIDFETASSCDLKKSGSTVYSEDPTTEVLCAVYDVMGEDRRLWLPSKEDIFLRALALDPEVMFVAHSAGFEKDIWRNIMVPMFDFPNIPNSRWHDTAAVCAYKAIPQGLDWAARVMRLTNQKDMEGSKITKAMSKPDKKGYYDRSPAKLQKVYDYCYQDIATQVNLHQRLGWLPRAERDVWLLDQRINERGVRLDLGYVRACQKIVDEASGPLIQEFAQITGGLKMTQRDRFMDWITINGASVPNLTKDTLADLLGDDEAEDESNAEEDIHGAVLETAPVALPENVFRALKIRQLIGSASIKKLRSMEACTCADGRARRLLLYHGTAPGRWAGRLLQPQNFPRGTLKTEGAKGAKAMPVDIVREALMTGDWQYVQSILGPPVEAVVSGLRHAIVASRGRVLISGDYAGIQARVVLALAGQHDKTALMASGADIYCDMASQIYKRPIDKKQDPAERQTGKNSVLGLGFQMGPAKFLLKYGEGLTLEFIKEVVRVYRQEWAPKVPKLWYALEAAAIRTVHERTPHEAYGVRYELEDGWLSARLPSGRKIWYANPQPTFKRMPWDPDDVRPSFKFQTWKMGQWIWKDAFGGLLTENVVMGVERDIMVGGMFRLEKNGFPIVLTVHDEIVAEPFAADADQKAYDEILCDVEPWVKEIQVPIAVEGWPGGPAECYRK
jgi:DNA polymerase bacteriophage-type